VVPRLPALPAGSSNLGTWLQNIAQVLLAYQFTHSASAVRRLAVRSLLNAFSDNAESARAVLAAAPGQNRDTDNQQGAPSMLHMMGLRVMG
jgi:hypothetical protein